MKSLAVIKRMIPALSAILDTNGFSEGLGGIAEGYVDLLTDAAKSDRLDLSRAVNALKAAAGATALLEQKSALSKCIAIADRMLDQIPAGRYNMRTAANDTVSTVQCRLQANLARLSITYKPSRAEMDAVRRDSSMFTTLVKGSIYDGQMSANDDIAAEQAYHLIDNAVEADFGGHTRMFEKAAKLVGQIAA